MSQRILVDINVLMDVLTERHPHCDASLAVWIAVYEHKVAGWVSADSFSTLYYLLRKTLNHTETHRGIRKVLEVFEVAPLGAALLEKALHSPLDDYEDAIQYECALDVKATAIITRDQHFRHAAIPVMTPAEFLAKFNLA